MFRKKNYAPPRFGLAVRIRFKKMFHNGVGFGELSAFKTSLQRMTLNFLQLSKFCSCNTLVISNKQIFQFELFDQFFSSCHISIIDRNAVRLTDKFQPITYAFFLIIVLI